MLMRALSIRQPWAWLITRPDITDPPDRAWAMANGILKDIENRTWRTPYRGGFLIHAGKAMTEAEYWDADDFAADVLFGKSLPSGTPVGGAPLDAPRGGIVGYAEITDCLDPWRKESNGTPSGWWTGDYGFKLTNQRPLPFYPLKGALGFFKVDLPDDYVAANLPFLKVAA